MSVPWTKQTPQFQHLQSHSRPRGHTTPKMCPRAQVKGNIHYLWSNDQYIYACAFILLRSVTGCTAADTSCRWSGLRRSAPGGQ